MVTVALASRTPIDTFQDILDAMSRHPGLEAEMRRHLQDEDLRKLPATVVALAETVQNLADFVQAMAERQERLESDNVELKAGQARLEAGQERHDAVLAELKAGQAKLEAGQARLEAGQERHDADIAELKAGQVRLEAGQERHDSVLAELKAGQARLEGLVGQLTGANYERHVDKKLYQGAKWRLGIHEARRWYGPTRPNGELLMDRLYEAAAQGAISDAELESAENIDLIIAGQDGAGQDLYAAVEASVTVDRRDVERVLERSVIIARALSANVIPVVAGAMILNEARVYAEAQQVTIAVVPEKDHS